MPSSKNQNCQKGDLEAQLLKQGQIPVGVDEVGRGCLAGPVVTAAVVLNYEALHQLSDNERCLIRDSKKLSAKQRQKIAPLLEEICLHRQLGSSSVREIEKLGIVPATFLAMHRSLQKINSDSFDVVLVDGQQTIPNHVGKQMALIGGDQSVFAIAAASILAKEARDKYMKKKAAEFPGYGFDQHVGYGTKQHISALHNYGVSPIHRRNFAPVSRMVHAPK